MKGLEEARRFYEDFGAAMLHERFPDNEERIAVGLAGRGSECFGFDDEVSRDHDFEQGFCLWLTDADDIQIGAELAKAYEALPRRGAAQRSRLGETNRGPRRIGFFYRPYLGSESAPRDWRQWLSLPSWALAEATNGEVFRDDLGVFSDIRETLLHSMPEDVRKKKLAARLIAMAQSGQYNYARCLRHGEEGAAMLALAEFVREGCGAIYLLNRAHMPYYKWALRALEKLPLLGEMREPLTFLLAAENDADGQRVKQGVVEDICARVIGELHAQGLSDGAWDFLEPHAFAVQERIENPEIRALHVMEG
jgi:hypothetical protein